MNAFEEAFTEMLDAQDEVRGRPITIKVNGNVIRSLEWPIKDGEMIVDGAIATTGGFRNQFLVNSLSFTPQVMDSIEASDGTELQIQGVNRINDTWQTEAFSPVSNRDNG